MAARKDLRQFATATFTCQQCGRIVTRADKAGVIYSAFMRLKFCGYACSRVASRKDHVSRFWEQVERTDGCWLWTGGLSDKGYGVHHKDGRKIGAHRYSYELHKGPLGKAHALHSCDNPKCVNPDHLRPGTHQDNMQDAKERRRFNPRRGSASNKARLTERQVADILVSSESGAEIARQLGVSRSTIYAVRNGQNWRHFNGASS